LVGWLKLTAFLTQIKSYRLLEISYFEKIFNEGKFLIKRGFYIKIECGPMPNVMAALPNIDGALCSTPLSLADAQY